jgi:hypothetical protein
MEDERRDEILTCVTCGEVFLLTVGEQAFYEGRLLKWPRRCQRCRRRRREVQEIENGAMPEGLEEKWTSET